MRGNKGFTLIELVMIIVILGILSVVAIPRYINMQQEASEAAAGGYIGAVNSALVTHIADHYLKGTAWVRDGEAAMALLEEGSTMPENMSFKDNVWSVEGMTYQYQFKAADDKNPPRIIRFTPKN